MFNFHLKANDLKYEILKYKLQSTVKYNLINSLISIFI